MLLGFPFATKIAAVGREIVAAGVGSLGKERVRYPTLFHSGLDPVLAFVRAENPQIKL